MSSRSVMRARRARWRSQPSTRRGAATSHNSAITTMAVALSARSMAGKLPAAGGGREEDDALGIARDLVEGPHQRGLAAPPRARRRDRGPQALVELGPESLDQLAFLGGDLRIAFGEKDLAMAGLHAQELH